MISYERLKLFLERKTIVHVSCDQRFYNGMILEISKNFIVVLDKKLGEVPILLNEIISVEPYSEVWK